MHDLNSILSEIQAGGVIVDIGQECRDVTIEEGRRHWAGKPDRREDRWQWIAERVAEHFHCSPDDVSTIDTDDELDLITVKGEPVARIHREYGLMAS